ncbi:hypothetical protein CRE_03445 [Caenorhabditis remanei]|uniref:Tyrosine-protein phosphatase domain-containing protein n=1 Tax=Caenorhabditis remanei TaxID=31234 RepID=E3NE58_CAERE|nr:hypothetical protein CRE_03445 [Caenorhabditis remanei]
MKTILLLALAIAAISSSPPIEDRQNNNYGDSHRNVLSASYPSRVYRGAGETSNLKTLLSQIQMVARVVNGVSLRAEISSGLIPPDQLIAELLSFGTATPTQIISIDNSKIQLDIDAMKKIPENLKAAPDVVEVEKTLKALESVLVDTVDTVALKNTTGVKEFKELVKALKDKKLMDPIESDFATSKKAWSTAIDTLKNDDLSKTPGDAKFYFNKIKNTLESINTVKAKLAKATSESPSKQFPSAISSLTPTLSVATEASKFKSKTAAFSRTPQQWTAYSNFIGDFRKTMDTLKPSLSSIQAVKSVVDGQNLRKTHRNQTLEYTSGFPHGASDMAMVFVDLTDAWMKGILKTDKLQLALEELRNVEVLAKKVEDVLRGQVGGAIDSLDKAVADFYPGTDSSEITSGIAEIQKCALNTNESAAVVGVVPGIQKLLEDIDKQFKTLGDGIQAYKTAASEQEFVKLSGTVKKICTESEKAADKDLEGLVVKMKAENLTALGTTVDSIYSLVAQIDSAVTTIQTNSEKISKRFADLDAFYTNAGALSTYLECVKSKQNLKSLIDAMAKIENLRKFDVKSLDALDGGLEVVRTVSKTADDLKKLNHSINEIKNAPMKYKSIQRIENANSHAKVIGSAVQAVSNMQNALEKKSEVEAILKNIDVTVIQKYNVNTTELEGLVQLNGSIVKMFGELETFKSSISIRKVSNLADQSEIFEKARAITGITGDIQKMRAGVEKLKEWVVKMTAQEQQALETLQSQLDAMDSMGMEFVKYHGSFDGVKKSLSVFDAFFVDFASDLAGLAEEEDSKWKEESNEDGFPILIIILVFIGLLLLAASIGNFIWNRKANDSFHLFYYRFYPHLKWESPSTSCMKGYVKIMADVVDTTYKTEIDKTPTLKKKDVFGTAFTAEYEKYATIGQDVIPNKKIDPKYCTTPSPIMANTAPVLKGYGNLIDNPNGEIHANVVNLADRKTLCLAQTPQHDNSKTCTVESYWWMVRQMKAKTVIHFNAPGEWRYYPTDPKHPFSQYHSDCLKVHCKKVGVRDEVNQIAAHTISVEFKGQAPHTVTLHDLEIGASGYPKAKQMAALLRTIVKQKRPVVIDCADGARYSGLLAFAALTTGFVLEEKKEASPYSTLFDDAMRQLRKTRKGCIRDAKDFAFGAMIVLEYLNLNVFFVDFLTKTADSSAAGTPDDSSAAGTPADSSAAGTPDDSSAAGTPDDSSAAGTPDDSSAAGTPDDSSAAGTPDDSTAAGTPADSSAAGTPDDSSAAGTPDDSSAAGTPDDSSAAGTPDDSSAAGTPADSTAAGTPDDSSVAGTPNDSSVREEMGATAEDSKTLREGWDLWEATPTPVSVLAILPNTNKPADDTKNKKIDVPAPVTTKDNEADKTKDDNVKPLDVSTNNGENPPVGQKPNDKIVEEDAGALGQTDSGGGTVPAEVIPDPPSVEDKVIHVDCTKEGTRLYEEQKQLEKELENNVLTMKDLGGGGPSGAAASGAPDDQNPLFETTNPVMPKIPKKKIKSKGTKSKNKKKKKVKKPTTEYEEDAPPTPEEKFLNETVME